jgi:hypothetical protein
LPDAIVNRTGGHSLKSCRQSAVAATPYT